MSIVKRRRFVNPGKKRRLTAKQIKFFGTKRQRAALKNRGRRKKRTLHIIHKVNRSRKRRKNVSHIVVVRPKNPGKRRYELRNVMDGLVGFGSPLLPRSNRGRRRNRTKVIFVNKGVKMARKRNRRSYKARRRNVHYVRRQKRGLYLYKNPRRRRRNRRNPSIRRYRRHRMSNRGRRRIMVDVVILGSLAKL